MHKTIGQCSHQCTKYNKAGKRIRTKAERKSCIRRCMCSKRKRKR